MSADEQYRAGRTAVNGPDFERGYADAVKWWTARPSAVDLSTQMRRSLAGKSDEYRAGWAAGSEATP